MKIKQLKKHLEELISDRTKQLGYCRAPEAKNYIQAQIDILKQIIKEVREGK